MAGLSPSRLLRRLRTRGVLPWAVFLLACLGLFAVHSIVNGRKLRAEADERDHRARFGELWYVVMPYYLKSPEKFAGGVNGGRPLQGHAETLAYDVILPPPSYVFDPRLPPPVEWPAFRPAGKVESFRVDFAGSNIGGRYDGWVVHLHFIDRKLMGASAIAPPRAAYRGPSPLWYALRTARHGTFWVAVACWVGCALILPFNRPWRQQIGQVALAAVLLASLCWVLEGDRGGLPHAAVLWIDRALAGAAALSLIAAVLPQRRHRHWPDAPAPCAGCGYDLTGNVSGVCPECGRITPQGLIDRWRRAAERIEHVGEPGDAAELQVVEEADASVPPELLAALQETKARPFLAG